MSAGNRTSGPHACKASTSPTEPLPSPWHLLLCFGTVGEVYHHAASEACPRGLGCDQLQLRRGVKKDRGTRKGQKVEISSALIGQNLKHSLARPFQFSRPGKPPRQNSGHNHSQHPYPEGVSEQTSFVYFPLVWSRDPSPSPQK